MGLQSGRTPQSTARSRAVVVDVPSEAPMTAVVRAALRSLAESSRDVKLSPRDVDEILVVLQEACTNVIRHAHLLDATLHYRVEFRRLEGALEILVYDCGAPFVLPEVTVHPAAPSCDGAATKSPPSVPGPESEPSTTDELREGGYGVQIMRTWMDEISVTHDGDGNVLRMLRRYRAATPKQEASVAARG